MDLSFLTVQVSSALRQAAFLFLISSGLTLVFGVLNILNFAHGALYMLGAYLVFWVTVNMAGPAASSQRFWSPHWGSPSSQP